MVPIIKSLFENLLGCGKGETPVITSEQWEMLKYHRLDMLALSSFDVKQFITEDEYVKILEKKNEIVNINTNMITEMKKIDSVFKREHIGYVILKGVSLALNAYPNIYQRYFSDVDILVDYESLDKVTKILHDDGYIQGEIEDDQIVPASRKVILYQKLHTHEIYQMVKIQDDTPYEVDVNFQFSWNGIEKETKGMHFDSFKSFVIEGKEGLSVFCDEIQLIHLCLHFYNEGMYFALDVQFDSTEDPEELLLHRLFDIILLMQKDLNLDLVLQIARQKNCVDKIEYVLTLIRFIMGESYISKFSDYFNVNNGFPNCFYVKTGEKVEWTISLTERLFDLKMKQNAMRELKERGVL